MSDRLRQAALALAAWLAIAPGTPSAGSDRLDTVLNGPVTSLDEIFGANGELHQQPCTDQVCAAMDDIARSFQIFVERDFPSGPAMLDPSSYNPHDYDERARRLLAAHPDRRDMYCRILQKVAQHFDTHERDTVGRWSIEIAALISPSCARSVVAAFPYTKAVADMLADARDRCETGPEPGCRFMVRPSVLGTH